MLRGQVGYFSGRWAILDSLVARWFVFCCESLVTAIIMSIHDGISKSDKKKREFDVALYAADVLKSGVVLVAQLFNQ